ncbi:hypothetical protein JL09_g5914 [Pichia kudriavzevii]|uniref:Uncharacterized protein n=2 Tax=Pichia kudriavzevii TaxID=4909 RepID=A0A099NSR2_PICKU|nr:hypothetical protein JL09_g5914 [Pichia kudriavzevii]
MLSLRVELRIATLLVFVDPLIDHE